MRSLILLHPRWFYATAWPSTPTTSWDLPIGTETRKEANGVLWAKDTPVSAKLVPAAFGFRCCAPGCGDKIKPLSPDETMFEVSWKIGNPSYLEAGCLPEFVAEYGAIPGLQ